MIARTAAARAVKAVAAAADAVRHPGEGVVVLAYHRVGRRSSLSVDVPVDLFTRQMEEVASSGRVLPLDGALRTLAAPDDEALPGVVVSFDDGTSDFVDAA